MEITAPPSSPALDAARAEMTEIATNPQNPRHAGYQRGEKQVMDYLDGRYKQAIPENKPVEIRNESVSDSTDFSEDTQGQADVEIALRIKELLYEDQYTIAGAKKRLANDLRAGGKLKIVSSEESGGDADANGSGATPAEAKSARPQEPRTAKDRQSLRKVAAELREILAMLETPKGQ